MNREIEFRGLDAKGVWRFGDLDYSIIGTEFRIHVTADIPPTMQEPGGDVFSEYYPVDYKTIGQYTGVKDKKDVKIFEDDICRAFKPNSGLGSQNDLYKVIYSIEFAQYVFYCIKSDNSYRINRIITKGNDQPFLITNRDVEVIGNIHSNPELL